MVRFHLLISSLIQSEVDLIIIGGLAAVAHGSAYLTRDLDVCYSREPANLERLARALEPFQPRLRGAPADLPFRLDPPTLRAGMNFTLSTTAGDLDLIGEVAGLGDYSRSLSASEEMEVEGFRCRVLTLEGLIRAKKASGRPKDLALVTELEALLELRRERR